MINKIKNWFKSKDTTADESRRAFLRGSAAISATAVVAGAGVKLIENPEKRWESEVNSIAEWNGEEWIEKDLSFSTEGREVMRIDSNGTFILGTTSPETKFQVF